MSDFESWQPLSPDAFQKVEVEEADPESRREEAESLFKSLYETPSVDDGFSPMVEAEETGNGFRALLDPAPEIPATSVVPDPAPEVAIVPDDAPDTISVVPDDARVGSGPSEIPEEAASEADLAAAFDEARATGHAEGYAAGHAEGVAEGQASGAIEGFDKGHADGKDAAERELAETARRIEQAAVALESAADALLSSQEPEIVELAIAIARKVVYGVISVDREVIRAAVSDALDSLGEPTKVEVAIHPDHLVDVEMVRERYFEATPTLQTLTLSSDTSVPLGGCRVVASEGSLLSTVDARLEAITEAVKQAVPKGNRR